MNWSKYFENLDTLFVLLFFILGLRFLLRPRKPKTIHAHFNKAIDRVLFWPISIILLTVYFLPHKNTFITTAFSYLAIIYIILNTIYVLYWSQPFSRKQTGVKAVDEAVARYKKPGERSVGVVGGWCPDLIVDGKAYKLIIYAPTNRDMVVGRLAFDLHGNVIRDSKLMDKLEKCYHFALGYVNPEIINARASQYTRGEKAQKAWKEMMGKYEGMTLPLLDEKNNRMPIHITRIHEAFEIFQRYSSALMEVWLHEADWGARHGNTKLKQVDYSDVMTMNQYWNEKMSWWLEKMDQFEEGLKSAKTIQNILTENATLKRRTGDLKELLDIILKFEEAVGIFQEWKEAGKVQDKYKGLDETSINTWKSRLEWADQVNDKVIHSKQQ